MWNDINSFSDFVTVFSEVAESMKATSQSDLYHAEGDVLTHTQMVFDALNDVKEFRYLTKEDQKILKFAAFFHDVAKPITTQIIDGEIRSPGHAKTGEKIVRELFYKRDIAPFEVREKIAKLVRHHGFPIWFLDKESDLRIEKDLISVSYEVDTRLLYILAKADFLGRIDRSGENKQDNIELFKEECERLSCFGKQRYFETEEAKIYYLHKGGYLDYVPYKNPKSTLFLLSGLPGAGKDTFIQKHFSKLKVISLDDMRKATKASPTDKKSNGRIAQAAKKELKEYFAAGRDVIFNATNVTKEMRSSITSIAFDYNVRVEIVYIEVPYRTNLHQNNSRKASVPITAINKLIAKMDVPTENESHAVRYVI